MAINPVFSNANMSRMFIVANFMCNKKHVVFMYASFQDTCHVLVDLDHIGYFKGDGFFRNPNHLEICPAQLPPKALYSFEKEYIPVYVATVTEYLLTGCCNNV